MLTSIKLFLARSKTITATTQFIVRYCAHYGLENKRIAAVVVNDTFRLHKESFRRNHTNNNILSFSIFCLANGLNFYDDNESENAHYEIKLSCWVTLNELMPELLSNYDRFNFSDTEKHLIAIAQITWEDYASYKKRQLTVGKGQTESWMLWFMFFKKACATLNPVLASDENHSSIIDRMDLSEVRKAYETGDSFEHAAKAFSSSDFSKFC